jgi:hypothetical protein
MHAFLTNWDAPISIYSIQLKKELAVRKLLSFILSKRYRAGIRLDALVDENVDASSKSMVRVVFRLCRSTWE